MRGAENDAVTLRQSVGNRFTTLASACPWLWSWTPSARSLAAAGVLLGAIRCRLLNLAAASDTVAPRPSTSAILPLAGSEDKTELVLPGGHVGCAAPTQLWPKVAN